MENEQINLVIDTNNAAVAAGDMDGILATFEPNGVLVGQPGYTQKAHQRCAKPSANSWQSARRFL